MGRGDNDLELDERAEDFHEKGWREHLVSEPFPERREWEAVHTASVTAAVYHPAGHLAATGDAAGGVAVWDVSGAAGACRLRALLRHDDGAAVLSLDFQRGGPLLASAARDGSVAVWNAERGERAAQLREAGGPPARVAVYSPDGRTLATAGNDRVLRLWSAATHELLHTYFEQDGDAASEITCACWSPDSRQVVCGKFNNRCAVVAGAAPYEVAGVVEGHEYLVADVAFAPDGSSFASASQDSSVCLWDARSLARLHKCRAVRRGTGNWAMSVAYSADSRRVVAAFRGPSAFARVWDVASGEYQFQLWSGHMGADMVWVAFRGDVIVGAASNGAVGVWDAENGVLVRRHLPDPSRRDGGPSTFAQDSRDVLSELHTYPRPAALRPDGGAVLAGAGARVLSHSLSQEGSDLQFVLDLPGSFVYRFVFTADSSAMLAYGSSGTLTRYCSRTGEAEMRLQAHSDGLNSAFYAPVRPAAGKEPLLLTSGDSSARVWDARREALLRELHMPSRVYHAAWSPDASWIVTFTTESAGLWRAAGHAERPAVNLPYPGGMALKRVWIRFRDCHAWVRGGRRLLIVSDGGHVLPLDVPDAGDPDALPEPAGLVEPPAPGAVVRHWLLRGETIRAAVSRRLPAGEGDGDADGNGDGDGEQRPHVVEVYDLDTADADKGWARVQQWPALAAVKQARFSADGEMLLVPSLDRTDTTRASSMVVATGERAHELHGGDVDLVDEALDEAGEATPRVPIGLMRYTDDGRFALTVRMAAVSVYDTRTGAHVSTLVSHEPWLTGMMVSPDSTVVATLASKTSRRITAFSLARARSRPRPEDAFFRVFHPAMDELPPLHGPARAAQDEADASGKFEGLLVPFPLEGRRMDRMEAGGVFAYNLTVAMLRRHPGLGNERSPATGDTLVHWACRYRRPDILRLVLGSLSRIRATRGALIANRSGQSALDLCVQYRSDECLGLLASYVIAQSRLQHMIAVTRSLNAMCVEHPGVVLRLLRGLGLRDAGRDVADGVLELPPGRRAAVLRGSELYRPRRFWRGGAAEVLPPGVTSVDAPGLAPPPPSAPMRRSSSASAFVLLASTSSLSAFGAADQALPSPSTGHGAAAKAARSHGTVAAAKVVPLPGLTRFYGYDSRKNPLWEMHRRNQAELFGTDIVRSVFDFKWETYGRRTFFQQLAAHVVFLAAFTALTLLTRVEDGRAPARAALQGVVGLFSLMYLARDAARLAKSPRAFWSSSWNQLDVVSSGLVAASVAAWAVWPDRDVQLALQSVGAVLLWLKTLSFARGFRKTGKLIRFLSRIVSETAFVVLVLVLALVAFGHGFALLYAPTELDDYNTWFVLLKTYAMMFGEFDLPELREAAWPGLAYLLFLGFTCFTTILLLNLLIALMSLNVELSNKSVDNEFEMERAKLMMEFEPFLPSRLARSRTAFPTWLHVLKEK